MAALAGKAHMHIYSGSAIMNDSGFRHAVASATGSTHRLAGQAIHAAFWLGVSLPFKPWATLKACSGVRNVLDEIKTNARPRIAIIDSAHKKEAVPIFVNEHPDSIA
jgi:hypothetical protein